MFDQREEQLLRDAFAARHRLLVETLAEELPLSEEAARRIERLLARRKHFYYSLVNTAVKRAACIVLGVLMIGSAVTLGVASVRDEDYALWVEQYEEGAGVRLHIDHPVPFEARYPTYLPNGYSLRREKKEPEETYLVFEKAGGGFFCYAQFPSQSAYYDLGDLDYERVTVGEEHEGFYIPNGEYTCLVFTEGKFMYVINGTLTKKELFKVAASVLK